MYYINKFIEAKNKELLTIQYKMLQIFPLKTDIIPGHIHICSSFCADLLWKRDILGDELDDLPNSEKRKKKENHKKVWDKFFKTGTKRYFKKNDSKQTPNKEMLFNHSIDTDGLAASIHFKSVDKYVKIKMRPKYIDELTAEEVISYKNRVVVGIDPNKDDLLASSSRLPSPSDGEKKKKKKKMSKYFRYTQCQSKEERKLDKYQEIRRSIYKESSSAELRIRFSRLQLTR